MATVVNEHAWERINEAGKISYAGTLMVIFDRDGAASGWTHEAAETAAQTAGYTLGSTRDGIGDCPPLRAYRTRQQAESAHIFEVECRYETKEGSDTDPASRDVNDEWVICVGGTKTIVEYFDTAGVAFDDSDGKHGVSMHVPTKIYEVHRIHSTTRDGDWEQYACHTNSGNVDTPGGRRLSETMRELLFLYATERPVSDDKLEVIYIFVADLATYQCEAGHAGGTAQPLLHKEPVATIDKETGKATAVTLNDVYDHDAIQGAMGDE